MNENIEIIHLTEEEQIEYAIKFTREYLLKIKEELERLESELEEEKLSIRK